ncbi:uncharacterized protein LOC111320377 [Stylophora pistillata]|nr:uncharacterized protein LOC111320377 [Stylophora pistillata]
MQDLHLPKGYSPSAQEDYMNPQQLNYFRQKLLRLKEDTLRGLDKSMPYLQRHTHQEAEEMSRATQELEASQVFRIRERQYKLLQKIEAALKRIKSGDYGYCAKYGTPIGLARLEVRPIATLSVKAQEEHERSYDRSFRHHDEDVLSEQ